MSFKRFYGYYLALLLSIGGILLMAFVHALPINILFLIIITGLILQIFAPSLFLNKLPALKKTFQDANYFTFFVLVLLMWGYEIARLIIADTKDVHLNYTPYSMLLLLAAFVHTQYFFVNYFTNKEVKADIDKSSNRNLIVIYLLLTVAYAGVFLYVMPHLMR